MEDRCAKGALSRANLKKTGGENRSLPCEMRDSGARSGPLKAQAAASARTRRNPPRRLGAQLFGPSLRVLD